MLETLAHNTENSTDERKAEKKIFVIKFFSLAKENKLF